MCPARPNHSLLTTNYEPKSPSRRAGDRSDEKTVIVRGALKLAFFTSDRTMAYESAVKPFVDAINAGAKGSLDIQVYFSGALGKSQAKTAHSVLNGVADIAFVVPGLAPDLFYDNTIIELPGLFRDTNEATFVFTRLLAANAIKGLNRTVLVVEEESEELQTLLDHAQADLAGTEAKLVT